MKRLLSFSLPVFLFLSCIPREASADIRFADVTDASGLVHTINGQGVCIFDMDNDGLEDIFIAGSNGRNLLYRNTGGLLFEEIGSEAGVDSTGWTRLVIAADYDDDGYIDLVLGCQSEPSRLFRNNGNGTFSDVTSSSGFANSGHAMGGTWLDYNMDGYLDLYVGNLLTANILCRNNGDGTFTEVGEIANAQGPMPSGLVMGVTAFDYDRDGDDDIFMAQDGGRGNFLLRRNPDNTFTDVSAEANIVIPVQGMGVAVGDYNRDGYFDVYVTNLDESTLFRNEADGTFSDVTVEAGVGDLPAHMGWGTFFLDMDNDGLLDLYNNNQTGFGGVPNSAYRNNGDGTFEALGPACGLISDNDGIGSAFADLDNDGDLDIVLAGSPSSAGNLKLFRNDSDPMNWVQFQLVMTGRNPRAVGAIAEVYANGVRQTAIASAGSGFASQNTLRLHFGLGTAVSIDSVVVFWPGGDAERFMGPSINAPYVLTQGGGVVGVDDEDYHPLSFSLEQNYPNPFNPATTIRFMTDEAGDARLRILDLLGQEAVVLLQDRLSAGSHEVQWDASAYPSGTYFAVLELDGRRIERKMILLK